MSRALKIFLLVLLAIGLLVGGYVIYVFASYYRLEDNIALKVISEEDSKPLAPGEHHRIVSYNVGFGAYSDDYSFFMDGGKESRARSPEAVRENIGGAAEAIRAAEPDLVLLQEVDTDGTRSHHIDEAAMLREELAGYSSVFAPNYDSPYLLWPVLEPHGANRSGLLTLSRFPITSALRRSVPIDPGPMKLVDLDRCYAVSRIPTGDRELVLYNFHLSAYTNDPAIANNQLVMLFNDMLAEAEKGNYAIAGGDFNKDILGNSPEVFGISTEGAGWAQPIPEGLIPAGVEVVKPFDETAPLPSCRNADRPYGPDDLVLTVDGFVVTDNVRVVASNVIDQGFRWSDHNPVFLDFVLEE